MTDVRTHPTHLVRLRHWLGSKQAHRTTH